MIKNPFNFKRGTVYPVAPVVAAPGTAQDNSIGVPSVNPITRPSDPPPPTLGGALVARPSPGGRDFDLYYPASDRPTFSWSQKPHQIKLRGQTSPKIISTLFDLAKEKDIGMPLIIVSGTPEFQILAVTEAARRGINVDTSKLCAEACRVYDSLPMDNIITSTTSAYESEDRHLAEQARLREADREKNADRADDRRREKMKMG